MSEHDTIKLGKPSFVSFGGVDITAHVEGFTIGIERAAESLSTFSAAMRPITLRYRGRTTPALYKMLFGRTHPRIRRMHSAYGRRRGRGRW